MHNALLRKRERLMHFASFSTNESTHGDLVAALALAISFARAAGDRAEILVSVADDPRERVALEQYLNKICGGIAGATGDETKCTYSPIKETDVVLVIVSI